MEYHKEKEEVKKRNTLFKKDILKKREYYADKKWNGSVSDRLERNKD